MEKPTTIYMAGSLFNSRELRYNKDLAERLKKFGYNVILPQEDGYKLQELLEALQPHFENREDVDIVLIAKTIIYYLDIGKFVPESDVVLANMDEPFDPGVLVESTHARMNGTPVIQFTTDSRSTYGLPFDESGGVHAFAYFQSDYFVRAQPDSSIELIANTVSSIIENPKFLRKNPSSLHPNEKHELSPAERGANVLLKDAGDIHSEAGVKEIVKRYIENKDQLDDILPEFIEI